MYCVANCFCRYALPAAKFNLGHCSPFPAAHDTQHCRVIAVGGGGGAAAAVAASKDDTCDYECHFRIQTYTERNSIPDAMTSLCILDWNR